MNDSVYKPEFFTCESCGRKGLFGCVTCLYRKRDLQWYGDLEPGKEYRLINLDLICGKPSRSGDLFHIPTSVVMVESNADFQDRKEIIVKRKFDGKYFKINATKPGSWDNYPITEALNDAQLIALRVKDE